MALPHIFKGKKPEEKKEVPQAEEKPKAVKAVPKAKALNKLSVPEKKEKIKNEVIGEAKRSEKRWADSAIAWQALKNPHVTEKAAYLAERNQYVFRVQPRANKPMVRKAVESLYGVDVVSVHITTVPPKKRMRGRTEGWRTGYKKAIVRVKEGQKIEILPR